MNNKVTVEKIYGLKVSKYIFLQTTHTNELVNCYDKFFKNSAYDLVKCNKILEDVNNEQRQERIIQNYHDGPNSHRDINETEAEIRKIDYWQSIKADFADYINTCAKCQ